MSMKTRQKVNQMDLNDGLVYADTKMKISAGTYADAADTNIVVLTAGAAQKARSNSFGFS